MASGSAEIPIVRSTVQMLLSLLADPKQDEGYEEEGDGGSMFEDSS